VASSALDLNVGQKTVTVADADNGMTHFATFTYSFLHRGHWAWAEQQLAQLTVFLVQSVPQAGGGGLLIC